MSEQPERPTLSRPSIFDHLVVLAGVALSFYLLRLAPLVAKSSATLDPRLNEVFEFLPTLLRLSEGIVLLWPIFFATQWFSRTDGLTAGEWLWLIAWVGLLILTSLTAWEHLLGLPEAVQSHAHTPRILWYMLVVPSLAALALLILVVDLFRSSVQPWTHGMGLALLLWPAVPAMLILTGGTLTR